jgi:hypothetical protein
MPNSGLLIASHQSHLAPGSYRHNRLFSLRSPKISGLSARNGGWRGSALSPASHPRFGACDGRQSPHPPIGVAARQRACRHLEPAEAYNNGAADGSTSIMVLAFEPADHDVAWMKCARECCADHGGTPEASGAEAVRHTTGRDPLRHTFDPLIEGSSWSKRLSLRGKLGGGEDGWVVQE